MYHRCSTIRNKCIKLSFFNFKKAPPTCLPIAMLAIQLLGSIEGFVWEIIDPSCHLYRILGSCSWSHVTRYRSAVLPPKKQHDPDLPIPFESTYIPPVNKEKNTHSSITDIVLKLLAYQNHVLNHKCQVPYHTCIRTHEICTENGTKAD